MGVLNNSKAFTFAELALVMLIIGIISVLTVPTLKKYTQRASFERGAQKAYLTLNEAFDQAIVEHGPPHKWESGKATSYIEDQLKILDNGLTKDNMDISISCSDEECTFTADVNGPDKEPNIEGKDIFEYKLTFAKPNPKDNKKDEKTGMDLTDKVLPQGDAEELLKNNWKFTDELWDK